MTANVPKVLVADDTKSIRDLLTHLLSNHNFTVCAQAKDGVEAVDLFKNHEPDITLLDLNMPNKNGMQALEEIMAFDDKALVIMVTAIDSMDAIDQCMMLGATDYVRKDKGLDDIPGMLMAAWQKKQQA